MPRIGLHKLLYLLLLLVSLSPLRGFAMVQVAEVAMSECPQMHVATQRASRATAVSPDCETCQNGGCEDHQCNMALCGAAHGAGMLPGLVGHLSAPPPAASPVAHRMRGFTHRTEPPLIRPPIAFHS